MTHLSELCVAIVDCEHKTAPKSGDGTGYALVRTSDIGRGRLDLTNVHRIEAAAYEEWTRRAVPQPGDLILAREAPVGNVALITAGMEPVLGQRTVLIRPDDEKVDPGFLTYRLLAHDVQHWMSGVANGATVPHLNMEDIRSLPLPELPPLRTQGQIAAVLTAFDDLIENNRQRIETLEEMARLLYREWFVHLRYPGHENVESVDSHIGLIPSGWEAAPLGSIATLTGGSTTTKASYVSQGYWAFSAAGPDGFLDNYEVDGHGVVLSAVGARCGRTFRASGKWSSIANTIRILPKDQSSAAWLHLVTADPSMWPKRGSAQPFVSINDARAVAVLVPPDELRARFEQIVRRPLDLVQNFDSQNVVLREARNLLLPRLVSGELDVSELGLDPEGLGA